MHDAAYIMIILDIAKSFCLTDFVTRLYSLAKSFKKFYARYQDLIEKYQSSVKEMMNDSFPE